MPSTLANFTLSAAAAPDDFIVGYDEAVLNGERRWTLSTIANAVSGLIKNEMANYMNNTLTIGNYPYMEFAYVAAPNYAGQTITNNNTFQTISLNSIWNQSGTAFATGPNSNIITNVQAGTYRFEIRTSPYADTANTNMTMLLALYDITNDKYLNSKAGAGSDAYEILGSPFCGQFELNNQANLDLRMTVDSQTTMGGYLNVILGLYDRNSGYPTNSTPNSFVVTSIKLWKVG